MLDHAAWSQRMDQSEGKATFRQRLVFAGYIGKRGHAIFGLICPPREVHVYKSGS